MDPTRRFRLAELTREELRQRLPHATVVVPTGATEQHGPHLPIVTDTLMAEAVALRATELASARADILVTSVLPFGCSNHHLTVGGALTVSQRTYVAFVVELAESLATMGCRRLVFLNGHGGNEDPLRVVANELVYERRLPMAVAVASYWTIARAAIDERFGAAGPAPGHAGTFETSCVLALRPDLVRLDARFPPDEKPRPLAAGNQVRGVPVRFPGVWEASAGVSDAAREATAEGGARAIDEIVREAADFLVAYHEQPFPSPPS